VRYRKDTEGAMRAARSRRPCDVGSHPSTADNSTEAQFGTHDTISEREVSNPDNRDYLHVKRNFTGRHFWVRGCCVSTVGLEEKLIQDIFGIRSKKRGGKSRCDCQEFNNSPFRGFHQTTRYAGGI